MKYVCEVKKEVRSERQYREGDYYESLFNAAVKEYEGTDVKYIVQDGRIIVYDKMNKLVLFEEQVPDINSFFLYCSAKGRHFKKSNKKL